MRLPAKSHIPPIFRIRFHFSSTRSNMGNLPVYHDTRAGGSKQVTIVRKFSGDMKGLGRAVEELCRAPVHLFHGRIEVKGHHAKRIKGWLEHLGF